MSKYLVINLGLKSIRIIVFNEKGDQIYVNSKPVHSNLVSNRVEQDTKQWAKNLSDLLLDLKKTSLSREIEYITSTTSSSCIYGMNEYGQGTTAVMMVSDKRALHQVERIVDLKSYKDGSKNFNYKCSTSSTIPKICWFKDNEPVIYDKTYKWLGASEFIHYFFTENIVSDPLNAEKAFHNGQEYDKKIFRDLGIDKSILPEVVPIGTELDLTKNVHEKYQFPDNCRFIVTTYDAICAVIGSYDGSSNTACDVSGTVTSVRILTDEKIRNKVSDSPVLSQELSIENKRLIGASNNMGGGIMEWHKQAFYDENDKNVYYTMENHAYSSTIGANGIIFLPYLLGERAPFKSVNAKATFFGVSRTNTIKDFTRAAFEATAFVTNDLLNLSIDAGIEINSLSVSGGLARFDLINQIKADVTNKKVKVLENFESTSVGAFILMAIAIKKYRSFDEASKEVVKVRKVINPSEKNHMFYKSYFDLFKSLNMALLEKYNQHSELLKNTDYYESNVISNL
jgi:sugar (pentulose or hexulose) kinase